MSQRLRVPISAELDARISAAAERSHVSKHEWVRRALEKSLHREGLIPGPVARLAKLNAPTADIDQMLSEIAAGRC
jgi:predicted transcriptional regulator